MKIDVSPKFIARLGEILLDYPDVRLELVQAIERNYREAVELEAAENAALSDDLPMLLRRQA